MGQILSIHRRGPEYTLIESGIYASADFLELPPTAASVLYRARELLRAAGDADAILEANNFILALDDIFRRQRGLTRDSLAALVQGLHFSGARYYLECRCWEQARSSQRTSARAEHKKARAFARLKSQYRRVKTAISEAGVASAGGAGDAGGS